MSTCDVQAYGIGIVSLSVCAPADMPVEEVTRQANLVHPSGLSTQWTFAHNEPAFADGKPHPGVCERDPSRKHYLFHC